MVRSCTADISNVWFCIHTHIKTTHLTCLSLFVAPPEKYFYDGESFKFSVGPVNPPVVQYDMMFYGDWICNNELVLDQLEIVC
jgi:hypothetical protein